MKNYTPDDACGAAAPRGGGSCSNCFEKHMFSTDVGKKPIPMLLNQHNQIFGEPSFNKARKVPTFPDADLPGGVGALSNVDVPQAVIEWSPRHM